MAITKGVLVQYKTNNGSVPAITLRQYTVADGVSQAVGSADTANLLVLGTGTPTRIEGATKDAGTTEATVTAVGKWWVPA